MIKTVALEKIFRTEEVETLALNKVSIEVKEGEFVAIMGPSGCGKSTLLNILGLLDNPTSGEYYLDGTSVRTMGKNARATLRNRKIGFVFQTYNLIGRQSALKNVELPMLYAGVPAGERTRRAKEWLERVGMGERMRHQPNELSGGQKQRVAIARAMVNEPALILADEPTGALDSHTGQEVLKFLQELNKEGSTVILITHDNGIAATARRVVRLADGRIIEDREQEVDWL